MQLKLSMIAGVFLVAATAPALRAGDWPQILGPHRNGIAADDEVLADNWPKEGPKTLWERKVGSGYAGVAVAGGEVFLLHREKGEEVLEALDAATGQSRWKKGHPTTFYPQVGGGDGPLCVPTLHDGRVITFGAQGVLSCHDARTGERLWFRETHRDFKALEGYFGAGSSPVVVGENVIVNVGGARENAGIVAFSLETGETLWQKTSESASYSAPTVAMLGERPYVVMLTRYKCLLLDPRTGAVHFQFPFGQRGPTVNGATPLVVDDQHLLVTAAYGTGSVFASFDILKAEPVWEGEHQLGSQYCTPIHLDGYLYAIDGRDDVPPADLKCLEVKTGKVHWVEQDFGYGTLILADGKLLAVKTNGELVLLRPSPTGPKVLAKARPLRGTVRALPAVSDGRLWIRDERTIKCLHVGP